MATKGCRALVWSRSLRDMAGLGQELTDEELAAQDFANGAAYRLTIFDYGAHVQRREWLMPLMFALMDATHGDVRCLTDFLSWFQVPFRFSPNRNHAVAIAGIRPGIEMGGSILVTRRLQAAYDAM
ncbi:hypothetical protein [Bifidobacterium ruminantium]|uniref:hypothetical protein n=1 Tax=Bifidobacterium ruminantium TaxID=78346 RepID=UPI00248F6F01|nr:hypothetical protein [Bifidobacterium ruminantium]